jgi:hypothetical protein
MSIVTKPKKPHGKVVRLSENLWEAVAIAATRSRSTIQAIIDAAVQDWLGKRRGKGNG